MRRLAYALLLLATPAFAAPVPKVVLTAEQEAEFNELWDSRGQRASTQVQYYCRLLSQPDAGVEYIRRLVKPAEMSEKQAKALIAELGSKEETTWRRAYRELRYRDIRLGLTLNEAWEETTSQVQRVRLACAVIGLRPSAEEVDAEIRPPARGEKEGRIALVKKSGSSYAYAAVQTYDEQLRLDLQYDSIATSAPPDWVEALERIRSPAAIRHLEALAAGREGANTTRYATAVLERVKGNSRKPSPDLDAVWRWKWYPFTKPDAANVFLDIPKEAVPFLKRELKPIKLTKDDAVRFLNDLFGDDNKKVLAAVRDLQMVDLQLQYDFDDLWELADTPTKRCRLVDTKMLWADHPYNTISDDFDIDERNKLKDYEYHRETALRDRPLGASLSNVWRADVAPKNRIGQRPGGQSFVFSTLKGQAHSDRWYHEESAIYILDAIGTDDAVAIIKDMATGHPDAGPTKAAKDVLKRRGVK